MIHPFSVLSREYSDLLAQMKILRLNEAQDAAALLLRNKARFFDVNQKTGVPIAWAMASFEREASSDFRLSPAQGDPWNRVSKHVPKGRGPFKSWTDAAIDAYRIDDLDEVGAGNWTWARACFEGELFNGFGYRDHGIHSPYLWAGTNIYSRGLYTSDGRLNLSKKDSRLGIVPMMVALVQRDASLALADLLPVMVAPSLVPPDGPPLGVGGGVHSTKWLQASLNTLIKAGLKVDGSYGRRTRAAVKRFQKIAGIHVDGFAGDQTFDAIEDRLAKTEVVT
jgi:lysozyme family protein